MRIAIVNHSDIIGGAAKAAYRLHKSLMEKNVESQMFVMDKHSNDETVLAPSAYKIRRGIRSYLDKLPLKIYKDREATPFSINWLPFSPLFSMLKKYEPDIIHLHWINGGFINIRGLTRFKRPIVWTLHDNWPFTGGCHIMNDCTKYQEKCGECPKLNSKSSKDLSRYIFNNKERVYDELQNLTVLGPSKWITKCAKKSKLFGNKDVHNIPNIIDGNIFKPVDQTISKSILSLPENKRLILFGAMNAINDPNKGYIELLNAINKISSSNVELVVFGNNSSSQKEEVNGIKTHFLGHFKDEVSLSVLYNAVDVMIVPSKQENLSNTIMESLACGTPVTAFDTGGNSDMIEHKKNGYLAQPFSIGDLATGIDWILSNKDNNRLHIQARNKVLKEFRKEIVLPKYLDIYKQLYRNL